MPCSGRLDQALDIIRIRRKTVETPVQHHCLDGLDDFVTRTLKRVGTAHLLSAAMVQPVGPAELRILKLVHSIKEPQHGQ
jgi:hypothetical protein